jgi:CelD/BcsL family acetyltransferase involved in cellulose biosynthesis
MFVVSQPVLRAPATDTPAHKVPAPVSQPTCDNKAGQMFIEVVRDPLELKKHLTAWTELGRTALEPNVFYEAWMMLPAVEAFGTGCDLRFVFVYARGPAHQKGPPILCGFFPLERQLRFRGLPVPMLRLWKHRHCNLCTPLLRAETASECLKAFFQWLSADSEAVRLMEFQHISGDGPFQQLLIDNSNESRRFMVTIESFTRGLLRCGTDYETYINTALSAKRRKELRRQDKLMRKSGEVEYRLIGPDDDITFWLEVFLQLEAKGWKGLQGSALNCHGADRTFFITAMTEAWRSGRLMLLVMLYNRQPIALKCNVLAGEGAFSLKIAFDETFSHYSPGMHLELENIRRLFQQSESAWPEQLWMDSCATPRHFMINRLWLNRRTIQTIVTATPNSRWELLVAMLPLFQWISRQLPHRTAASSDPGQSKEATNECHDNSRTDLACHDNRAAEAVAGN